MNKSLSYGSATKVVLIGTSTSPKDEKNLPDLPHVVHNITDLIRLFKDPKVIGLDDSSIVKILDENDSHAIIGKVRSAAKEATDTLLVYYAGHGLYGDAEESLYLIAKDSTSEDKAHDAIAISKLRRAIAESPAPKRILILDCCYSGSAFAGGGMDSYSVNDAFEQSIAIAGTYGVAAAPANHKALAPPGNRLTAFTKELVDVLDNGLPEKENTLTLGDVFGEVRARLRLKANMPVPEVINWKNVRQFRFAKNRYGKRKTTSDLINSMDNLTETMEKRFSVIDELILEMSLRSKDHTGIAFSTDSQKISFQERFNKYSIFVSIVFSILMSNWAFASFTFYKNTIALREVYDLLITVNGLQGVLLFFTLTSLWWWYGAFLRRMDPADSFFIYGLDFWTFGCFAIAFQSWIHPGVFFPIIVFIAAILMSLRFSITRIQWNNDPKKNQLKSALIALHIMLLTLITFMVFEIGSSITIFSLSSNPEAISNHIGWTVVMLLIFGIIATCVAVIMTEGLSWSQPNRWYESPSEDEGE